MYRSFGQMWEGWTKNLALLFPNPRGLALRRAVEFVLIVSSWAGMLIAIVDRSRIALAINGLIAVALGSYFCRRIRRAHFDWLSNALAIFGLPLFTILLLNSYISHRNGSVRWKGRSYGTTIASRSLSSGNSESTEDSLLVGVPVVTDRKSGHSL